MYPFLWYHVSLSLVSYLLTTQDFCKGLEQIFGDKRAAQQLLEDLLFITEHRHLLHSIY